MVATATNIQVTAVDFDPFAGPSLVRTAPVTHAQTEIWLACQFGGDAANRAYNESISLRLSGLLDQPAFDRALQTLVGRHEALHAAFSADGQSLCIFDEASLPLAFQDCTSHSAADQEKTVAHGIDQDARHVFDLVHGPLLKARLLRLSDTSHHFTLTAHHIICDGWSLGVLLQELSALYTAYTQHTAPNLPPAPLFSTFAANQLAFAATTECQTTEAFWQAQYRKSVPVVNLPTDFPRPALRTFAGSRADLPLDDTLVQAVRQLGLRAGSSFVTTLMAAFELLLHRTTGQPDTVLGLPTAGQSVAGLPGLVGHCVNLLPLRSIVDPSQSFMEFLTGRKGYLLDAYEHQQLTFGRLLQTLAIPRDPARIPLVPVIFNVDMGLDNGVRFAGLTYQLISNPRHFTAAELFVNVSGQTGGSLTVEWTYNTDLFTEATIIRLMAEFVGLLQAVTTNPALPIGQVPTADYPRHTPLHQLLANTAARLPQKIALRMGQPGSQAGETLTYQGLHETANQLAHYLRQTGIGPGSVVGVLLDRSPNLLIALLAVLKAGAAYVPIDPDYPQERIAFMLTDSSASLLLTTAKYAGAATPGTPSLRLGTALTAAANLPKTAPDVSVSGHDQAYILYTSGSTGKPKGVQVDHQNLVNLLYSMLDWPGMTEQDVLLAVTTISFDIAGLELYLPLLCGGTLLLADADTTRDGHALLEILLNTTTPVSLIQATPITYKMLLAAGWPVLNLAGENSHTPLKILCCGEPLSKDLAQAMLLRCDSLWNMYGPTETTIYSTGTRIFPDDGVITIGKPIHNTQVYILDDHLNPVPAGEVGELFLAGDGVARGYLNRPELTAEKFILNPFSSLPNQRMYRTGDLGRFLPNGNIHCLGRIDQQVKIRGYRIELGEIEYALRQQPGIRDAVVLTREDRPGDRRLVGYLVSDTPLTSSEFQRQLPIWRTALRDTLPDYMVPSEFVSLAALPVTPNGKIDRQVIGQQAQMQPKQGIPVSSPRDQAPATDLEKRIAAIWTGALGIDTPSIQDDFFEVGGHSLIAVQVMTQLEQETGRRLPLSTLLTHPTIEKLAQVLQAESVPTQWKSLVPIRPQGSKTPIYVIHGIGLNLLNFSSLVAYMHPEQPIYGFQARGLDGMEEPLDNMEAIAAYYIAELLDQNPTGPYAIAGYSFGGYVALEMARQLKAMGKAVKLLGMFDTNAEESLTQLPTGQKLWRKLTRQFPKLLWIGKSFIKQPLATLRYQQQYLERQLQGLLQALGGQPAPPPADEPSHLQHIIEMHETAYERYTLKPYDGSIDLFKAQTRLYFVEDSKYLGWAKYARGGVRVHLVPGDHKQMMLPPNDIIFAQALQKALDNA